MLAPVVGIAVAVIAAGTFGQAFAQPAPSDLQIEFNIPAQPLSRALVAYGTATGLEIFYNAALADNRHATAVTGRLTPSAALKILLSGTGYIARATGVGALTITPAPPDAAPAVSTGRRLEPYFAAAQARISDALCRSAAVGSDREVLFQFWLSATGVVLRAEVIDADGQPARDQSLAAAIRGLVLGAPPAGMPQPVTAAIFPPSRVSQACGPATPERRAG